MIIDDRELRAIFVIAENKEYRSWNKCECCLWRTLDMQDKCSNCVPWTRSQWKLAHTGHEPAFLKNLWKLGATEEQQKTEAEYKEWQKQNPYPFF